MCLNPIVYCIWLNCWFSHDVTKIQTTKLSILPRFYFHDVLEKLKTNFQKKLRFKRVLGFVIEYAWISKHAFVPKLGNRCFCWFPSAMLLPIQVATSMASPPLYLWVRISRIREYSWPESWRGSLYIYLLSFPRFRTWSIERFWFLFWSTLNGVTLKTNNTS